MAHARPQQGLEDRFPVTFDFGSNLQQAPRPTLLNVPIAPIQPAGVNIQLAPPQNEVIQEQNQQVPESVINFDQSQQFTQQQQQPQKLVPVLQPQSQVFQQQPFQQQQIGEFPKSKGRTSLQAKQDLEARVIKEDRLEPNEKGIAGFYYETTNGQKQVQRTQPDQDGYNTITGSYS